jgi:hypothetical protein
MKMRPPMTVGCATVARPAGSSNAHFSLSFETSDGVRCAISAGWKRRWDESAPHPFQRGFVMPSAGMGAASWHKALGGNVVLGLFCALAMTGLPADSEQEH